jgi:hypothetical protein
MKSIGTSHLTNHLQIPTPKGSCQDTTHQGDHDGEGGRSHGDEDGDGGGGSGAAPPVGAPPGLPSRLRSWICRDLDLDGGRASLWRNMIMYGWCSLSLGSSPLYIGLGGPLGPPNTVHMTWGNPRIKRWPKQWRNTSVLEVSVIPTHDTGSDTTRTCSYGCTLKWLSFPHTDIVFVVLWVFELVWTGATTPWSWICILWLWK